MEKKEEPLETEINKRSLFSLIGIIFGNPGQKTEDFSKNSLSKWYTKKSYLERREKY